MKNVDQEKGEVKMRETAMQKRKVILLIVLVVYWIWPLDFIPGNPIDDLIVTIAYAFVSRNRLKG